MRVCTKTGISLWSKFCKFRNQMSFFIEEFFCMVAFQPFFQKVKMFWWFHRKRYLMCTERSFNLKSVNNLWSCPSLWSTKNDHWPERTGRIIVFTGIFLDCFDFFDAGIHSLSHFSVHSHRIVTFYEVRFPSAALEEVFHFLMRNTWENGRVTDLVSVQMKDWKNSTVCDRVQEFVGLPWSSKRPCFSFTVTDNNCSDKIWVVQNSTKAVSNWISKFSTLIDRTWCFWSTVTRNSAWEWELLKHFLHTFLILADVRINFTIRTFQISVGNQEVSAMSRTGKKNHIQIITFDDTVAVYIDEVLSRYGSPVSDDFFLDLIHCKWLF